ncbi:MAG: PhnD/SsuA/transferrin family substrate-binding protein [Pseudomonadota bacterium]
MYIRSIVAGATLAVTMAVTAPVSAQAETWSIAVTDVEGMERLQLEWGPFKEALEAATGDEFEFFAVNSRTAAAEALRAETVDFVVSGPAEYVVINKLTDAKPIVGLGRPDYFCAVIVRADSGYNSVKDLKGEKIAMSDIGSTSGHLCPTQLMADLGLGLGEFEPIHTSRNIGHEAVKNGDIAAMGTNHNSWLRVRNGDETVPNGFFKIIARSGDLPNDMIMVGAHVPAEAATAVQQAIIDNKDAIIAGILAHEENDKYNGMDLVVIEDSAYDSVRAMYTNAGFPQFDNFLGE